MTPIKEKPLKRRNLNNPQIKSYTEAIKRGQNNIHVVYKNEKGWEVKKIAASGGKIFNSQSDALRHARSIAQKIRTEVFVHGRDGLIRERESYKR